MNALFSGITGAQTPRGASTPRGGGGGGTLNFSAYVGSDPASTLHHKKKYQEFQTPKKNI